MDPLGRILHLTNTATTPYKNEPALAPELRTGRRSWVKEGMDSLYLFHIWIFGHGK